MGRIRKGEFTVLIETLWNVKVNENNRFVVCDLSINRNIVECKADRGTLGLMPPGRY